MQSAGPEHSPSPAAHRTLQHSPAQELTLPEAFLIPEVFRRHREHHGAPALAIDVLALDKPAWNSLQRDRQDLLIHVISRFAYAASCIVDKLPRFHQTVLTPGEEDLHRAIEADTRSVARLCLQYMSEVAESHVIPREALTPKYLELFHNILSPRFDQFQVLAAEKGLQDPHTHAQEVALRTVYHLIAEGLGAMSGLQGLRMATAELNREASHPQAAQLPGLENLITCISLVERRNVAYGLFCLDRLRRQRFLSTVRTIYGEFKEIRPTLEAMRSETFDRWPDKFPFTVDQKTLANRTATHVKHWIYRVSGLGQYRKVKTLEGIL